MVGPEFIKKVSIPEAPPPKEVTSFLLTPPIDRLRLPVRVTRKCGHEEDVDSLSEGPDGGWEAWPCTACWQAETERQDRETARRNFLAKVAAGRPERPPLPVVPTASPSRNREEEVAVRSEAVLLTTEQVAILLRLKAQTLAAWRLRGKGPAFVKIGALVRYERRAVEAFVEQNRRQSTADQGGAALSA